VILNNDGATELESEHPILRPSEDKDLSTPVSSLGNRACFQYCEIILNFFHTCVSSGIWWIFSISHEHWSTCYTNVSLLSWYDRKLNILLCLLLFVLPYSLFSSLLQTIAYVSLEQVFSLSWLNKEHIKCVQVSFKGSLLSMP
jgi:hypothetical protein